MVSKIFYILKKPLLRVRLFVFIAVLLTVLIPFFSWKYIKKSTVFYPKGNTVAITMCGTFVTSDQYLSSPVKLLKGLGDLHYSISTTDSLTQKYFDQGIRLIYGFNHVEALRSFREASHLDPNAPMTYWGQALALGPNINDWNPKDREAMAWAAISKALELSTGLQTKEADFIKALSTRYDGKVHEKRDTLNIAYAQAMEACAKKYPNDSEVLVLYADAVMNTIPWDYWNKDGSPKSGTLQAKIVLESALKKFPNHPGAHHLYVHLLEASSKPNDAYKSAVFLETAMPKAGHIVHMPSHIYVRVGEYERSNASNTLAIQVDEQFLAESEDQGFYRIGYYPHNIDFLVYGNLMNGHYDKAYRDGAKLAYQMRGMESVMPVQYDYFISLPIITYVRFGAWNEILALPLPDTRYFQTMVTHHFARGVAFLRKGMLIESQAEFKKLDAINKQDTLKTIYASFYNSAYQISNVATYLLKGELLIKQNKQQEGIEALQQAVSAEDALQYNEPPDWRLPARHFLGAALLDAGQYIEAEKVFLRDLIKNPENGWALQGLLQSQKKLGKNRESAVTQQRFDKAWKKADVKILTSRF